LLVLPPRRKAETLHDRLNLPWSATPDIVNPWREMVAKELEFGGVDQVDMVQGSEWSWLLGVPDPGKPEVMRLPTAQEVTERVRRDTRWAYTMGGKNLATQATEAILKGFGVKA